MSVAGDSVGAPIDLITIGRSSIDLYANQIGAPFVEIESFGAFVGGCPLNIAVGARRLGLNTALLSAIGDDPVGAFILRFLQQENVDTRFMPTKPGHRTSAVLLGIEPPDKFPLVYYRDNCADMQLDIDDVGAAPIDSARAVVISGTALSGEPCRSATLVAAERAKQAGVRVLLDLDFRLDQWHDPRAYGVTMRSVLPWVDIVIGTAEEVLMAASVGAAHVSDSQISNPEVAGDLPSALRVLTGQRREIALKRGQDGSQVYLHNGSVVDAAPFEVDVVNVLGAGDAFAAGFVYGLLSGWDYQRAARMGNATGALVVTRQGCANFMPSLDEALALLDGDR